MDRDHTFDLPDLTEDFWKTVVFAQKEHPSGMGGPGCVWPVSYTHLDVYKRQYFYHDSNDGGKTGNYSRSDHLCRSRKY